MPELPEVETARRGIEPHLLHQVVSKLIVRNYRLRWPISKQLGKWIEGKKITSVERRAKYLLIHFDDEYIILHLGMSGRVRVISSDVAHEKHDHIDLCLGNNKTLRFTDPRRFGCCLSSRQPQARKLLDCLGPEPLTEEFNSNYLWQICKTRKVAIKQLIMNNQVVVGVGNIYAAESLFKSGISPKRAANNISQTRIEALVVAIKSVLKHAIQQGGTTLKDFTKVDGQPGYFKQELQVYGREGDACSVCNHTIVGIRQGQRATAYCPHCQR